MFLFYVVFSSFTYIFVVNIFHCLLRERKKSRFSGDNSETKCLNTKAFVFLQCNITNKIIKQVKFKFLETATIENKPN